MAIDYEVRDRIAYIAFCRPEKHNAVRREDLVDLRAAFERLDRDDDADVAILHGQGRSFSSGADIHEIQQELLDGEMMERAAVATAVGAALERCEHYKPVIAAIHGYCMGNGFANAFMCDLVVAARSTRMQAETRHGVPVSAFWLSLGGEAFGLEVNLTGRVFTAEEADAAGVIAKLVDDGHHLDAAEELAREMLECPQDTVRQIVRVRRALVAKRSAELRAVEGDAITNWAHGGGAMSERFGRHFIEHREAKGSTV
jgi:enoyl-CoA hydratase/carnithine racemase